MQELEQEREDAKDVFSGLRRTMSANSMHGSGGPGSNRPSPNHRHAPASQNDDVTQELMSKIQTLMIENEEMKLKNSVLQSTVEALSDATAHSGGGGRHNNSNSNNDNNNNNNNTNDEDTTEWH